MTVTPLDDEAQIIAETAAFATKKIAPLALEWDADHHFPVDVLREAAELGMAAIYCSEDAAAAGCADWTRCESSSSWRWRIPAVAAFLSIHNMCAWMVDRYGTREQRKAWVPRLASMEAVASYCLTEPSAGSDAFGAPPGGA